MFHSTFPKTLHRYAVINCTYHLPGITEEGLEALYDSMDRHLQPSLHQAFAAFTLKKTIQPRKSPLGPNSGEIVEVPDNIDEAPIAETAEGEDTPPDELLEKMRRLLKSGQKG